MIFHESTNKHDSSSIRYTLALSAGNIYYYSSAPFSDSPSANWNHAVLVIHGNSRDVTGYFDTMTQIAISMGKSATTLVVAPYFQTKGDNPPMTNLYWSLEGWKEGNNSTIGNTSSYTVIDTLVAQMLSKFTNIKDVTIAGHSAGGQFVQRYVAGNILKQKFPIINFHFVVANPGSYMYLNQYRPVSGTINQFAIPTNTSCHYDDYKYGLQNRNNYMSSFTASQLINQYITGKVTYLLGELDTKVDSELDQSCAANFQGPVRIARGQVFMAFLNQFFPTHHHNMMLVPNAEHSQSQMFTSDQGKTAIFGPF